MSENTNWLPPLILLEDFQGNWQKYEDAIYGYFKQDFIDSHPIFQGRQLGIKRYPLEKGKEATFWHLISEGMEETNRKPELRRCERVRWPRPIIEKGSEPPLKIWPKRTQRRKKDMSLAGSV